MTFTKKRQRWAAPRKDVQFKGTKLAYPASVQSRYASALKKLSEQMVREYRKELDAVFDDTVTTDASIASQARIRLNQLKARFMSLFTERSGEIVDNIFGQIDRFSEKSLGESLREISGGITIPTPKLPGDLSDAIKAATADNVALIKSIPEQFHLQIEGAVMRSIQPGGNGLQDVHKALTKYDGITKRRAEFIARDQTKKVTATYNSERVQAVGIEEFEWIHSGKTGNPRKLHKEVLNGKTFRFDDLPVIDERTGQRGLPGQLPNCDCGMRPKVSF